MAQIPYNTGVIESNTQVSLEISNQPTVEQEDINFIKKVVEHINTLPGTTDSLKVQTNTGFPSRYVLMISNLPKITLEDLLTIETLAPRLRSMSLSLKNNYIKIDMWKNKAKQRKTKRKIARLSNNKWNFKSINKKDIPMLERILDSISNLSCFPCQFHTVIKSEPPNYYHIDITTNDTADAKEIKDFKHQHRAFVKHIFFNFPQSSIRLEVEKASANTENQTSGRKILTVYKKQRLY
jgi:hypothetical protein